MKVLTLIQPWDQLILDGLKLVENRTWKPNLVKGAWFGIHAGKPWDYLANDIAAEVLGRPVDLQHRKSGIYGAARFLDCFPADHPVLKGDFFVEGPWCWVFSEVIKFDEPIFVPGRQRLWSNEACSIRFQDQLDKNVRHSELRTIGKNP